MKEENEKSKEKCKLPTLNTKQVSCETLTDEAKKKNKKGKKLKKNASHEENATANRTKSFVRKYIFGQHAGASSSADGHSSMADVGVDGLSSASSTSTLSLVKRHTPEGEDTSLQEACASEISVEGEPKGGVTANTNTDKDTVKPPLDNSPFKPHHPVSVTPYPISTWRKKDNIVRQSRDTTALAYISQAAQNDDSFMENKLVTDKSKKSHNEDDKSSEVRSISVAVPNSAKFEQDPDEPASAEAAAFADDPHKPDSSQCDEHDAPEEVSVVMPAFGNLVMDNVKDRLDNTSNVSHSPLERQEHLYKILVIGELGTGKTSIIKRYVHQFFSQHYRATIGVDFALKVLNWDANTIIRLQLWDIAGQERFGNMTRVYYKDAVGAFIVFDVTRVATFDAVVKWKQDLDSKVQLPDGSSIPCVLLGNKCDQQKEGTINTPARMDEYCKEKGFAGWFETSAKENINIEEAAKFLVNKIFQNDKLLHSNELNKDNERIAINSKGEANGQNLKSITKSCAC